MGSLYILAHWTARRVSVAAAIALLSAIGCGGSNGPTDPVITPHEDQGPIVVITVLEGDKQEVAAGQRLPQPVRVSVRVRGQPACCVQFRLVDPETPTGRESDGFFEGDGIFRLQPVVGNVTGPFTITIFYRMMESSVRPAGPFGSETTANYSWYEAGKVTVTGTIVGSD